MKPRSFTAKERIFTVRRSDAHVPQLQTQSLLLPVWACLGSDLPWASAACQMKTFIITYQVEGRGLELLAFRSQRSRRNRRTQFWVHSGLLRQSVAPGTSQLASELDSTIQKLCNLG